MHRCSQGYCAHPSRQRVTPGSGSWRTRAGQEACPTTETPWSSRPIYRTASGTANSYTPPCRPAAPCNSATSQTGPGRVRRRRAAGGPSSCAPSSANRRSRRTGKKGSSTTWAWSSAIPCNRRARPSALIHGNPAHAVRIALIFRARADQAIVLVLLQRVRRPSGHAAHREDRREQIHRNAQRIIGRGRVEIYVGDQPFFRLDGLLHGLRHAEQLLLAGAAAQLLGKYAQVRGPRIFSAIYAVPETGDLHLARQRALHPVDGGFLAGELQQNLDHVLVRSAVQRAF